MSRSILIDCYKRKIDNLVGSIILINYMAKNIKFRSAHTGVFRDSLRVRNSRGGTQYVRAIDVILSDKVASKMKRASEAFRSVESGRVVSTNDLNNAVSSSKKK